MAPQKRAAKTAAAAAAPAKRERKDPMLSGIQKALEMAQLPDPCKHMLSTAAPHCLGVAREERHASQRMIVEMIGEVVSGVCSGLVAERDAQEDRLTTCLGCREELEAKVKDAELVATTAAEVVAAKAAAATGAESALASAQHALQQKTEAQRECNEDFDKAKAQRAVVDKALNDDFKALLQGDAESHFDAMQPLLTEICLGESLLSALSSTCRKAPSDRGPFDSLVLEQLGEALRERSAACARLVAEGEPAAEARAAEVAVVLAAEEEAAQARRRAAEALAEAQASLSASEVAARVARETLAAHAPEVERLTKARDAAAGALAQFVQQSLVCFENLRDLSSSPPDAAIAQEAPTSAQEAVAPTQEASAPQEPTPPAPALHETAPDAASEVVPAKTVTAMDVEAQEEAPVAAAGA